MTDEVKTDNSDIWRTSVTTQKFRPRPEDRDFSAGGIIRLSRAMTEGAPSERKDERIKPWGGELELETKVDLTSREQVKQIIERIKAHKGGIAKFQVRREQHQMYASDNQSFDNIIERIPYDNGIPWIRTKEKGRIIETPGGIPAMLRPEHKLNPLSPDYDQRLADIRKNKTLISRFDKGCVDISFWDGDLAYTMTFSLAQVGKEKCFQAELEYEGFRKGTPEPTLEQVLPNFEKVTKAIIGDKINLRSKVQWLAIMNGKEELAPEYLAKYCKPAEQLVAEATGQRR